MREISGQIPENSKALVSDILNKVTGYSAESIEHIKGIGMNNSVTVANTSHGRFVVRTNVESHLFRYQREAWCFEQLKNTPVLTPTVLGSGIMEGHSYSVAPFITDSRPIVEGLDRLKVWEILGNYAQHLNKISPPNIESKAVSYFPATWEQQVTDDMNLIFQDSLWLDKGLMTTDQQDFIRQYLLECVTIKAPRENVRNLKTANK